MTQHTNAYHIEAVVLAEQATAAVRASLPTDQIGGWIPAAYEAVLTYLTAAGVNPAGPPYARYAFHDTLVEVEAGFPVPAPVPGHGDVVASSLPDGPAALTTHHGPYEHLDAAYHAVTAWLTEQGLQPAGPHWEVYHTDPRIEPDPARWRTDLIIPYQSGSIRTNLGEPGGTVVRQRADARRPNIHGRTVGCASGHRYPTSGAVASA